VLVNTEQINTALNRLNAILPLAHNQSLLPNSLKKLHQDILNSFIKPEQISLAEIQQTNTIDDLITLEKEKLIVLDDQQHIDGAYPFSCQQREHTIKFNRHTTHAMCALDALSVAPMFGINTQIDSICRVSGKAIQLQQSSQTLLSSSPTLHAYFGIIWASASNTTSCSESLCLDMVFLHNKDISTHWQAQDSHNREVFNLHDALKLGTLFFKPLMQ